jgi:hypothetical protein
MLLPKKNAATAAFFLSERHYAGESTYVAYRPPTIRFMLLLAREAHFHLAKVRSPFFIRPVTYSLLLNGPSRSEKPLTGLLQGLFTRLKGRQNKRLKWALSNFVITAPASMSA